MLLSILIPCYNEEKSLPQILEKIHQVSLNSLNIEKEIIAVDDGSSDATWEILNKLSNRYPLRIFHHETNMGKGRAIRSAIQEAKGDVVLIQDADLEYDPGDYPKLIEPILTGKYKVVYGSRNLQKNPRSSFSFYWGGRFLSFLANLLYGTEITDEPTCYKVFDAQLLKSLHLECERFEFCPEVTAKIAKMGVQIYEVPISYCPRSIQEGKKIRWKDGIEAAWTLIKHRFNSR